MADRGVDIEDTVVSTWFERDRQHVCLSHRTSTGDAGQAIVEWWDLAVDHAMDDGALDSKDWHGSAFAYARDHGLLVPGAQPVVIKEAPKGVVAASASKGVYMGWRTGGAPIWSTEATEAELARGAYSYGYEDEARDSFAEDLDDTPDDMSFTEVELDVIPDGMRVPTRSSLEACENAGIVLPTAAPAP